jgi:hypothetical protein
VFIPNYRSKNKKRSSVVVFFLSGDILPTFKSQVADDRDEALPVVDGVVLDDQGRTEELLVNVRAQHRAIVVACDQQQQRQRQQQQEQRHYGSTMTTQYSDDYYDETAAADHRLARELDSLLNANPPPHDEARIDDNAGDWEQVRGEESFAFSPASSPPPSPAPHHLDAVRTLGTDSTGQVEQRNNSGSLPLPKTPPPSISAAAGVARRPLFQNNNDENFENEHDEDLMLAMALQASECDDQGWPDHRYDVSSFLDPAESTCWSLSSLECGGTDDVKLPPVQPDYCCDMEDNNRISPRTPPPPAVIVTYGQEDTKPAAVAATTIPGPTESTTTMEKPPSPPPAAAAFQPPPLDEGTTADRKATTAIVPFHDYNTRQLSPAAVRAPATALTTAAAAVRRQGHEGVVLIGPEEGDASRSDDFLDHDDDWMMAMELQVAQEKRQRQRYRLDDDDDDAKPPAIPSPVVLKKRAAADKSNDDDEAKPAAAAVVAAVTAAQVEVMDEDWLLAMALQASEEDFLRQPFASATTTTATTTFDPREDLMQKRAVDVPKALESRPSMIMLNHTSSDDKDGEKQSPDPAAPIGQPDDEDEDVKPPAAAVVQNETNEAKDEVLEACGATTSPPRGEASMPSSTTQLHVDDDDGDPSPRRHDTAAEERDRRVAEAMQAQEALEFQDIVDHDYETALQLQHQLDAADYDPVMLGENQILI